jgi:hypothetical protein
MTIEQIEKTDIFEEEVSFYCLQSSLSGKPAFLLRGPPETNA